MRHTGNSQKSKEGEEKKRIVAVSLSEKGREPPIAKEGVSSLQLRAEPVPHTRFVLIYFLRHLCCLLQFFVVHGIIIFLLHFFPQNLVSNFVTCPFFSCSSPAPSAPPPTPTASPSSPAAGAEGPARPTTTTAPPPGP